MSTHSLRLGLVSGTRQVPPSVPGSPWVRRRGSGGNLWCLVVPSVAGSRVEVERHRGLLGGTVSVGDVRVPGSSGDEKTFSSTLPGTRAPNKGRSGLGNGPKGRMSRVVDHSRHTTAQP